MLAAKKIATWDPYVWPALPDEAEQAALKCMAALRKRGKTLWEIQMALAAKCVQLSHEGIRKLIAGSAS